MMAPWMKLLPWNMIDVSARSYDMDVNLIAAMVMQETGGGAWKTEFEPDFKYLYKVTEFALGRGITEITETIHQKTSWGLLQIMGASAREIGFRGDIPELARPAVGLKWGCIKLRAVFDKYGKNAQADIAAAWNHGSAQKKPDGTYVNQKYVVGVMRYYTDLTGGQQ